MITLNGDSGITTPTYGGTVSAEYSVPVTAFKNRIINGNMAIDQRNAGASVTATGVGAVTYVLDRFAYVVSQASKMSIQQSSTAPTGFSNSTLITSLSAYSILSSDYFVYSQFIEGYNVADLGWGTASASTVTLSFWVRSSLTGTFGGSLQNTSGNRSYPFSYTISSANTWEQKTITITGDTTGTWLTTNGVGIKLYLALGTGSTYAGTAGAWAAGNYSTVSGATSVVGTNGATFYITGVQLEKGSTATSFDYRPYGTELQLCQRYYEKSYAQGTAPATNTSTGTWQFNATTDGSSNGAGQLLFKVTKRSSPTVTFYRTNGTVSTWDYARSGASGTTTPIYANESDGGFLIVCPSLGASWTAVQYYGHWIASSEL